MLGTSKVRDIVRLHPKTCSDHQAHVRKKAVTKPTRKKTDTLQMDQRVWKKALEVAGGDRSRIVVRSATEVVVVNRSLRKA